MVHHSHGWKFWRSVKDTKNVINSEALPLNLIFVRLQKHLRQLCHEFTSFAEYSWHFVCFHLVDMGSIVLNYREFIVIDIVLKVAENTNNEPVGLGDLAALKVSFFVRDLRFFLL